MSNPFGISIDDPDHPDRDTPRRHRPRRPARAEESAAAVEAALADEGLVTEPEPPMLDQCLANLMQKSVTLRNLTDEIHNLRNQWQQLDAGNTEDMDLVLTTANGTTLQLSTDPEEIKQLLEKTIHTLGQRLFRAWNDTHHITSEAMTFIHSIPQVPNGQQSVQQGG